MQQSKNSHQASLRSAHDLETYLAKNGLSWRDAHLPEQSLFTETFPVRIPEYYARLIDWTDPGDPLRKMVLPDPREKNIRSYELDDPIGDQAREAVPGLIHRYPDRCLLLLTSYCLVHCRFCFRREVVGKVRPVQFTHIQRYLHDHHQIEEIIFSGGDPFTFPVGFVESMIRSFAGLQHIRTWRFHSRIPAIDPTSINEEWFAQLQQVAALGKKVVVVIHINHPREVTSEFTTVVKKLLNAGCLVLSQSVLLKEVNTDKDTLTALFKELVHVGVKPYYLHHLDQVLGSHHFRISIEEGKALYRALRGNISSVCLPEYVIDLPGGKGKVPVMWLEQVSPKTYEVTSFLGERVRYVDQADS